MQEQRRSATSEAVFQQLSLHSSKFSTLCFQTRPTRFFPKSTARRQLEKQRANAQKPLFLVRTIAESCVDVPDWEELDDQLWYARGRREDRYLAAWDRARQAEWQEALSGNFAKWHDGSFDVNPRVLIVHGKAGTGKTFSLRYLAKKYQCKWIDWSSLSDDSEVSAASGTMTAAATTKEMEKKIQRKQRAKHWIVDRLNGLARIRNQADNASNVMRPLVWIPCVSALGKNGVAALCSWAVQHAQRMRVAQKYPHRSLHSLQTPLVVLELDGPEFWSRTHESPNSTSHALLSLKTLAEKSTVFCAIRADLPYSWERTLGEDASKLGDIHSWWDWRSRKSWHPTQTENNNRNSSFVQSEPFEILRTILWSRPRTPGNVWREIPHWAWQHFANVLEFERIHNFLFRWSCLTTPKGINSRNDDDEESERFAFVANGTPPPGSTWRTRCPAERELIGLLNQNCDEKNKKTRTTIQRNPQAPTQRVNSSRFDLLRLEHVSQIIEVWSTMETKYGLQHEHEYVSCLALELPWKFLAGAWVTSASSSSGSSACSSFSSFSSSSSSSFSYSSSASLRAASSDFSRPRWSSEWLFQTTDIPFATISSFLARQMHESRPVTDADNNSDNLIAS